MLKASRLKGSLLSCDRLRGGREQELLLPALLLLLLLVLFPIEQQALQHRSALNMRSLLDLQQGDLERTPLLATFAYVCRVDGRYLKSALIICEDSCSPKALYTAAYSCLFNWPRSNEVALPQAEPKEAKGVGTAVVMTSYRTRLPEASD